MLHINNIQNISEMKELFAVSAKGSEMLIDVCGRFFTKNITRQLTFVKSKGFKASEIILVLLHLPFLGVATVRGLIKSGCARLSEAEKDVYYRLKNNPAINWRSLLMSFAKRFNKLSVEHGEASQDAIKCFIIDDSDYHKTGKKIEFIGKIFDHVSHRWVLGFKLLTLGFWDGASFNPLDFSLHNEKGKNKKQPYGLKKSELKKRFSKERPADSAGAKRARELSEKKNENAIKMIKRAVKNGFLADYVLADSWFISQFFIVSIRKIKENAMHVLGMCKMDKRKYVYCGQEVTAKQLLSMFKKRKKRSRKINASYIELEVKYKGTPVKLFFSRYSHRGKWHLLLTTDLNLNFNKAIEIYGKRWSIEVFFKDCKQYLNLGKCQANDFDAQIADTTISMMQYIALNLKRRFQAYESIGELFREQKSILLESTIVERLWGLFLALLRKIVELFEIDIEHILQKFFTQADFEQKIVKILRSLETQNDQGFNYAA